MSNKEIANMFSLLAGLMELHQDNPFKIRSYQNAYIILRKLQQPLSEIPETELAAVKGIGKSTAAKIQEILRDGTMERLEEFKNKTPGGIQEMMGIKGLGPKKIRQLWKDLEVETPGELLYACMENRLVALNGFGLKTQDDIRKKLEYFFQSRNKYHYASIEKEALSLLALISKQKDIQRAEFTGKIRRKCPVLESIEILVACDSKPDFLFDGKSLTESETEPDKIMGTSVQNTPVHIYWCNLEVFGHHWLMTTGSEKFTSAILDDIQTKEDSSGSSEPDLFQKAGLQFVPPELRESAEIVDQAKSGDLPKLIEKNDIKGVVHAHSTYSDGLHSLEAMAQAAKDGGFEYLAISDHSKTAFYANGLQPERVLLQMEEIDKLNEQLAPFVIFKGIESDILYDGRLDYEEDILEKFDFVIASVHSQLKMDEEKATSRLISAIRNPFTTILGHPTGRLLLSREGYPINHKAVIDTCAEEEVAIEMNANPLRLDLDWTWIEYALKKGVKISVNPDAHSKEGIRDIHFGILAARKGGLTAEMCLNSLTAAEFLQYLNKRKTRVS